MYVCMYVCMYVRLLEVTEERNGPSGLRDDDDDDDVCVYVCMYVTATATQTTTTRAACPNVNCTGMTCRYGFSEDSNGCPTCRCRDLCDVSNVLNQLDMHGNRLQIYQIIICIITVTMVFYSNLCFIVNLMPFTVSAQPFRTMFYVSMHFCDFIVVFIFFLLFFVYVLCSLSVSLPGLANKDVHNNVIYRTFD